MSFASRPARLALAVTGMVVGSTLVHPTMSFAQWPPDSISNLQVLPDDIAFRELVGIMGGFTRALGVRCQFCHVGEEEMPLAQFDFASDEKPTKRKARGMLRMVQTINTEILAGFEERVEPPLQVRCATCHGGVRQPRPIEDIVVFAYQDGGVQAATERYRQLRDQYYGRAAYDFGSVPLTTAADRIETNSCADAVTLLELNVELHPGDFFAQLSHASLAIEHSFMEGGPEAGVAQIERLRDEYASRVFAQQMLNAVGYSLLRQQRTAEAVTAFQKNVELYPTSWNAHDSLGEGYMVHGNRERAISSYERSLELNPDNANARAKLAELRGR